MIQLVSPIKESSSQHQPVGVLGSAGLQAVRVHFKTPAWVSEADKYRAEIGELPPNTLRFPLTLHLSHPVLKCTLSPLDTQLTNCV